MTDMGLFFNTVAELTGESPLLMGIFGAGEETGAVLGYNIQHKLACVVDAKYRSHTLTGNKNLTIIKCVT